MQPLLRFLEKRIGRVRYHTRRILSLGSSAQPARRVIFMHIPKCGGTSVNALFKDQLGSGRSRYVALVDDTLPAEILRERIARAADAQFVGGHFGFETLEKIRKDAWVFTVVRDPFDRVRSIYGHLRTRPAGLVKLVHDPKMTLKEFLSSDHPNILQLTDNVMARMLAGSFDRKRSLSQNAAALSRQAIANLQTFDHVGFASNLDDTLRIAADMAGLRYASYFENNTSAKAIGTPPAEAISPIAGEVRELANARLQADLSVYEFARTRFASSQPD